MPSYNIFYESLADAGIDWVSDTIKIALFTSSYTPDRTVDFYGSLANQLATGDGYTTGGYTLTGKTVSTVSNQTALDAADPTWTFTATKAFRYAVVYKDTGTAGTSPLIWSVDLGVVSVSGVYTLQLNASGFIRFGDAA